MLVPMRSCLSVAVAGAQQGLRRVMHLGAAVLCSGTAVRLVSARHSVDSLGQSGCYQDDWLLIRSGGGRT